MLHVKVAVAAAAVALALMVPASPAEAKRPRADVTPGCVDTYEYNHSARFNTKASIDRYLHLRGHRALFAGEVDLATGQPYPARSRDFVKFVYPACAGSMFIVYERPNQQHPDTREWVYADYQEH